MHKHTCITDSAGALANTNLPVFQAGPLGTDNTNYTTMHTIHTHIVSHALCTDGNCVQ